MEHSSTEDRNPASKSLDTRAPIEIIKLMHEEDLFRNSWGLDYNSLYFIFGGSRRNY